MKKFFFIIVFFSLISFEVNSQEILISCKGEEKPIVVIQGVDKGNKAFLIGDRVSVVYGAQVRVLPSNN